MGERARLRLVVLRVLIFSLFLTLVGRLYYLQVIFEPQAKLRGTYTNAESQAPIITPPVRGEILDAHGRSLAGNLSELVVYVRPADLYASSHSAAVLTTLSRLLKIPYDELVNRITPCQSFTHAGCWQGVPYAAVPVSTNTPSDVAQQIVERLEDFPGVTVQPMPVRHYDAPAGVNAAQILGYLAPATKADVANGYDARQLVGRSGLEAQYESVLAGTSGVQTVRLDPTGQVVGTVSETAPVPGDNIVLSLDAQVQALTEHTLADAIAADASVPKTAKTGLSLADKGSAVVMDTKTGRVIGLATYPGYDPNVWVGGISNAQLEQLTTAPGNPLNNWAIAGEFPPGSTFKLVTTVGAVADGLAAFDGSKYDCKDKVTVGGRDFHNFEGVGLGPLTLHDVIVHSCDTTFYTWAIQQYDNDKAAILAKRTPPETQQRIAREFGFGAPTGLDLPLESGGLIEDRAAKLASWAKNRAHFCFLATSPTQTPYQQAVAADQCAPSGGAFNVGDQANFNIGQGTVLVTPLQIATAYGALVNGGKVFSPTIGWGILAGDGAVKKTITPAVRQKLTTSPALLQSIQDAMCQVPRTGTAKDAFVGFDFSKVTVCGKTGTAQTTVDRDDTSWFASFGGPVNDPKRYVVVVVIPDGGHGSDSAAPAVRKIWEGMFGLAGTTPIDIATSLPKFTSDGSVVGGQRLVRPVPAAYNPLGPTPSVTPTTPSPTFATPTAPTTTQTTNAPTSTGTPAHAPSSRPTQSTPTPAPTTKPPPTPTATTTTGPTPAPGTTSAAALALALLGPLALRARRRAARTSRRTKGDRR